MNAAGVLGGKGSVQSPPCPRIYRGNQERKLRPIGGLAQGSVPLEGARRYVELTPPGASFDPVHSGQGPRVPYDKYQRVERVALPIAEPDYGYDFEYDLSPREILELERRIEVWLLNPEFIQERESAKQMCLQNSVSNCHSRLPASSIVMIGRGVPETQTGRPVIGMTGRHARLASSRFR